MAPDKLGFAALTGCYLATTTAEWLLSPLFPLLAPDLGLGSADAGIAFSVLAGSVAIGGLAGGFLLVRLGPRPSVILGLLLVAAGAAASAAATGRASLLPAQVVLGFGSGTFFAPGLLSAATFAGERRRGLAIGIFGVAFSAGVAVGGLLAALGSVWGWRASFLATAALALAGAGSIALLRFDVPRPAPGRRGRFRLRGAVAPVTVGGVAAASQYGTVAFLPLFAVHSWGFSPGAAALVITASRVLSVPAKLLSGNSADRAGSLRIARRLGLALALLGAWWTIAPGPSVAVGAAVLFGAFVAALGPVANVLALDAFEDRAQLLGAFRATQLGLGAATSALLGTAAAFVGLRISLAVAAVGIPATLLLLGRARQEESSWSIPN